MTWKVLPATSFSTHAAEWDRLNIAMHGGHPMLDSRFVGALLTHFGDGSERLCLHDTGSTIDGALILRPLGIGRWATLLPTPAQIGTLLVRRAREMENLFFALPGYAWSIDLLAVDPDFGPDWSGFRRPWRSAAHTNTISVDFPGGFETYWNTRSKRLVKNLARYRTCADNTLAPARLSLVSDRKEIPAALERYAELESAGWKDAEGTAIRAPNDMGRFYAEVLTGFAAAGAAMIAELYVGETLAASRLIIRSSTRWVMLKATYDESHASIAADRQLLFEVLKVVAAAHGSSVVESYTNANRDQAEWATRLRPISHHQIYRNEAIAFAHSILPGRRAAALAVTRKVDSSDQAIATAGVEVHRRIDELPASTRETLDRGDPRDCETSAGWFANLQETVFRGDPGVRYYVATYDSHPTAILPVRHLCHGPTNRIEAMGNYYTSLFRPALAPDAGPLDLAGILAAAKVAQGKAHVMRFEPMDPDAPAYSMLLSALRSIGWIPFRFYCFGNWHLAVEGDGAHYIRQREGILRSTLKRKARKFASEGGRMEIVVAPNDVAPAIEAYNEVYSRSWKRPEPYPEFVPGLIRWLADEGKLRLGVARLGERPIAAQIWIVSQGKASIFKLAYDEAHADSGAGTLLTAHLMQHVIDIDGVREVDYLIGDDPHKQYWMDRRRERWGIVAYNPRSLVGASLLITEIIGRTIRKMTQAFTKQAQESAQTVHWQIEPIARFDELAPEWDRLQATTTRLPFLESLFLGPLLAEFGTGREVLAIARRQGHWCAATILTRSRTGAWETFQPSQLPLGAWISSIGAEDAALYVSLMRALPGVNVALSITQQDSLLRPRPDDTATVQTLDYIATAWVDIDRPFDTYWEERGKNLRTNARKQRTKLESEGVTLHLECITAPEGVEAAIADYGMLESAGWKGKDGTAVHADNAQGRFYRKMLESFCAAGRGRIYRYAFNDKPVAMDLCIESGDRIVILKTTYDESYKTVSPSTLMRQDEFRVLFEEPQFKRIEFYGKVMEWHKRWTEASRTIYHITAYRWAWMARLHTLRRRQLAESGDNANTAIKNEQ